LMIILLGAVYTELVGVTLGHGRSRSAYPPVQNDSGLAQGPAGASRAC